MSNMSSEERQKRRERLAAQALESVAKSEQFNFRVDSETIKRLYKVAADQKKPVGALVREWVLERLNQEQMAPSSAELMHEIHLLRDQTLARLEALSRSLAALNERSSSSSSSYTVAEAPGKTCRESHEPEN